MRSNHDAAILIVLQCTLLPNKIEKTMYGESTPRPAIDRPLQNLLLGPPITGALSVILLVFTLAIATVTAATEHPGIALEPVTGHVDYALAVTAANDGSGRLFVVTKDGLIYRIRDGRVQHPPFLDIRQKVSTAIEQGLLGLAFAPDHASSGRFYINYTDTRGNTVIARYHSDTATQRARPASEEILLRIKQPAGIHNGGHLQFGPDGYLYIGLGDGGSFATVAGNDSGGDPHNHAQNPASLLGKLLRIDVSGAQGYTVPDDNPFTHIAGARAEIWALGLRNPWRFSFDRELGDLFTADVGEVSREEINFQRAGDKGGNNYGWRRMEGRQCFNPPDHCNDGSLVLPIMEYDHFHGCAVIGGYRYRGHNMPALHGVYLYADYCQGRIFGARPTANPQWDSIELLDTDLSITGFGEDEHGELYITGLAETGPTVFRLVPGRRD